MMNENLLLTQKTIPTIVIALSDKLKGELIATFESKKLFKVISILTDGEKIFEILDSQKPDYLLIDSELPNGGGFGFLRRLDRIKPSTKVIIYSSSSNPDYLKVSLSSFAYGFIQQGCGIVEFMSCLKTIFKGERMIFSHMNNFSNANFSMPQRYYNEPTYDLSNLTKREMDIWELLEDGKSEKEIAENLFIDKGTVRKHKNNISGKLEIKGKKKLTIVAMNYKSFS
jgi:two-component system, NarL family, response regulator FusR